jgi:endonuclease-3
MSATNRATLINKTAKVLKKHYKPQFPPADRSVLEHLLYACCLENSPQDETDDVFAKLQANYFDWNEIRVTTVAELSEVMSGLRDPEDAARRLKRTLQSLFETHYSFDVDFFRKQNLGKSVKEIEGFSGVTPFVVSYAAQNALGGHSIPVNASALSLFVILGVINESEAAKKRVPGLERTIAKSKGVEFGSLLQQLAVDYAASPFSSRVRSIVLEIAPDAKDRFPKRAPKKPPAKKRAKKTSPKAAAKKQAAPKKKAAKKSTSKRLARKKPR